MIAMVVTRLRVVAAPGIAAMALGFSAVATGQAPVGFEAAFRDKTMRVDYIHSGGPGQEVIALD